MGRAVLRCGYAATKSFVEIPITWEGSSYDLEARVRVPERAHGLWAVGIEALRARGQRVTPYPTLPIGVELHYLERSATGAFAIASYLFDSVQWVESPPYPSYPVPAGADA